MSKSIKANARTVAAPQTVAVRPEVKAFVVDIADVQQSLNAKLYEAAMWCRDNQATDDELAELLAVIDRRKRADFKRIITAPADAVTKAMPTNLVQAAQFIRARVKGASAQLAKSYATGKTDGATLAAKLGTEPKDKAEPDHKRDVALPVPAADEVGNIKRLADLLPALEAELAEYGPGTQKALASFKSAAAALIAAAANG